MPTTSRNIRIDDELWAATAEKAKSEDRTVSEVIRELLTQWIAPPEPPNRQPIDPYVRIGIKRVPRR